MQVNLHEDQPSKKGKNDLWVLKYRVGKSRLTVMIRLNNTIISKGQ